MFRKHYGFNVVAMAFAMIAMLTILAGMTSAQTAAVQGCPDALGSGLAAAPLLLADANSTRRQVDANTRQIMRNIHIPKPYTPVFQPAKTYTPQYGQPARVSPAASQQLPPVPAAPITSTQTDRRVAETNAPMIPVTTTNAPAASANTNTNEQTVK